MASVNEISDRFVDDYADIDVDYAVDMFGIRRSSPTLTDHSPDGHERLADVMRSTLAELRTAPIDGESDRLGAIALEDWISSRLATIESGERQRQLSPIFGAVASTRMVFDLTPHETAEEWEIVAQRLGAVPEAMAGYTASLNAAIDKGDVASWRLVDAVADQCRTWSGGPNPGWFSTYAAGYSGGPLERRLAEAGRSADDAYAALADWLQHDYRPHATDRDGVGEDRYAVAARAMLGIADFDIDDAYAWGREELERLEAEQARECERILPGASMEEVVEHLERPEACIDGAEAYRDWLQQLTDEAIAALNGTEFDIAAPLLRCDVVIPPAGSAAAPYYNPPSEDLSAPGHTNFPTMGRDLFAPWSDVSTVYHEAVPGHHLQIGLTRIMPLTRFHRLASNSAHIEGWALYAERLMDELGWFRTPDTRLGFLSAQAFRAARVVIDIGLHTGRRIPAGRPRAGEFWTFDHAIEAAMRAGGLSRPYAESEVLRYMSAPAQAISYKIGERVWLEGREAAITRANGSFDRKAWHASALALGSFGLDRFSVELDALAA